MNKRRRKKLRQVLIMHYYGLNRRGWKEYCAAEREVRNRLNDAYLALIKGREKILVTPELIEEMRLTTIKVLDDYDKEEREAQRKWLDERYAALKKNSLEGIVDVAFQNEA